MEASKKKGKKKAAADDEDEDMDDEEALMRELAEMDTEGLEGAKKAVEKLKSQFDKVKREALAARDSGDKAKALELMK